MKRNYTSPKIIAYKEVRNRVITTSGDTPQRAAPTPISSLGILQQPTGPVNGSDALTKDRGFAGYEEDFENGWK